MGAPTDGRRSRRGSVDMVRDHNRIRIGSKQVTPCREEWKVKRGEKRKVQKEGRVTRSQDLRGVRKDKKKVMAQCGISPGTLTH